jgi:DNA polymerase III psi subunit
MTSILLKGVIRNGRVEGEQPINLPEGIRLIVTSGTEVSENGPLSEDEIARVQATVLKPGANG